MKSLWLTINHVTAKIVDYIKKNPFIAGLFFFALTLRLISFFSYHNDFWYKTYLIDDNIFNEWALGILQGDIFSIKRGIFRMNPGYPYTLALIYFIFFKATFAPQIVQYIVGSINVVLIFLLSKNIFGKRVGMLAGIIASIYGMSVFYQGKLLGPVWINFFNLLMLLFLTKAYTKKTKTFLFLAGTALGISSLYLPTIVVFTPFALVWIFFKTKGNVPINWPKQLKSTGIFVLGIVIVMMPVMIRNIVIDKKIGLVLTTSSGGINFYLGNNPESNGYNAWPSFIRYSPGKMHDDFKIEAQKRSNREMTDSEVSSFWFKESLSWIKHNPQAACGLVSRKFIYFWNAVEPPDNFLMENAQKFSRIFAIPLLTWGIIAPFAILGIFLCLFYKKGYLLVLYLTSYLCMNIAFYILSRYRFPAVIGIIICAAFALSWIYDHIKQKKWQFAATGIIILVLLFLFVHKKVIMGELEWSKHYSVGVIYSNRGRPDEALEEYKKSIFYNPNFAPSRMNIAILYIKRSEFELAVEHLIKAAHLSKKDHPAVYKAIGDIYLHHLYDYEKAEDYLKKAVAAGNLTAQSSLGKMYADKKEYDKAIEILQSIYKNNPASYQAAYDLGVIYIHKQDPANALQYIKKSLELNPDFKDGQGALYYIENKMK